jgi:hypothetical protein
VVVRPEWIPATGYIGDQRGLELGGENLTPQIPQEEQKHRVL